MAVSKNDSTLILGLVGLGVVYFGLVKPVTNKLGLTTSDKQRREEEQKEQASANPGWDPKFYLTTKATRTDAEMITLAKKIYKAWGAVNDDEQAIYAAFRQLGSRLLEVEKELKESDRRTSEPFNKFLAAAAPYSEHIVAGIMGKAPQTLAPVVLSGVPADAVHESDAEAQEIFENFVQALAEAKPHTWKIILQQLTTLIKSNPTKFETALTFLN